MKITEIAVLNESSVQEAPQGMLKRAGLGIMKKFGSAGAAGKLETGKIANQLKKGYQQHLGKTGRPSSAEELMSFLKSMGYPTQGVEKLAKQLTAPKDQAPKGPLANKDGGPEQPTPGGASAKPKANNPNLKIAASVYENVITELKGGQLDKLLMRAAQDAAYMQSGGDVTKDTTGTPKQKGPGFIDGVKKGFTATDQAIKDPIGTLTGKNKGKGAPSNQDKTKTRASLNVMKKELGVENPQLVVNALAKIKQGKMPAKNELDALQPMMGAIEKAMQDQAGRQRLKQVLTTTNKK
tara:strand:- start:3346 stop:4230 length:885 start_codon:yes stop_codon:yes gene_type:complete